MKKVDFFQAVEQLKKLFNDLDYFEIKTLAGVIVDSLKSGGKLLVCGNGGSAADAQHMAAEFVNRFLKDRQPLAAMSLTTDTSVLTSVSNDYSFDKVFAKQVEAIAKKGDVLVGISTSGNSRNIYEAFLVAKNLGVVRVGLLGKDGGVIKSESDYAIVVPSLSTPRIQEIHTFIIHTICQIVEDELSG